jgi:tetratricopeptide (TPR) repeat protein
MKKSAQITLLACLLVTGPMAAFASGGGSGGSGGGAAAKEASDRLSPVRKLTASGQWQAAIAELQRIDAKDDPDWNNLMGYCQRRKDQPDFAAAERYYAAALAINPRHRPTLEYLGELRLQQGDLARAEHELELLKKATFFRSEEFKDLQKAIAAYKAAGNRYVAEVD